MSNLLKIPKKVYNNLKKVLLELIKRGFLINRIYIFGDYRKGLESDWNSVNIIVVSDNFQGIDFNYRVSVIHEVALKCGSEVWFEPLPLSEEEFNGFYNKIKVLRDKSTLWIEIDDVKELLKLEEAVGL